MISPWYGVFKSLQPIFYAYSYIFRAGLRFISHSAYLTFGGFPK